MEAAFNACSLKVYVQEASALPDTLFDSTRSEGDVRADWEQAKAGAERDVAFFGRPTSKTSFKHDMRALTDRNR